MLGHGTTYGIRRRNLNDLRDFLRLCLIVFMKSLLVSEPLFLLCVASSHSNRNRALKGKNLLPGLQRGCSFPILELIIFTALIHLNCAANMISVLRAENR